MVSALYHFGNIKILKDYLERASALDFKDTFDIKSNYIEPMIPKKLKAS